MLFVHIPDKKEKENLYLKSYWVHKCERRGLPTLGAGGWRKILRRFSDLIRSFTDGYRVGAGLLGTKCCQILCPSNETPHTHR